MPLLKSLPENATLLELFNRFPEFTRHLAKNNHHIMRGASPLDAGQREMIAAYVSALNSCQYCTGSHSETAKAFGMPAATISGLIENIDTAAVAEELKPMLKFVRKLTLTPARMTAADADAVFAAGWDDEALFSAVAVCCVFNFMNRLVEGTGLVASEQQAVGSARILHEKGYQAVIAASGIDSD